MNKRTLTRAAAVLFAIVLILVVRNQVNVYLKRQASAREIEARQLTFDELRPVALRKCQLERFGEVNDGGYLTCGNLLGGVGAAYSYGISGYDQWGCQVSTRFQVATHQYDCFNTDVPSCPGGGTRFHPECVGAVRKSEDGREFDSIAGQMQKNGDAGKQIVVKMDIEEAEWDVLARASDDTLARIDQLIIEMHGVPGERALEVVRRLKQFFHVAHFHTNNFSCVEHLGPFPSWAYEVTFVSKHLDEADSASAVTLPHPLDALNNPNVPDCRPAQFRVKGS